MRSLMTLLWRYTLLKVRTIFKHFKRTMSCMPFCFIISLTTGETKTADTADIADTSDTADIDDATAGSNEKQVDTERPLRKSITGFVITFIVVSLIFLISLQPLSFVLIVAVLLLS